MEDKELFELCKQVYEKTRWNSQGNEDFGERESPLYTSDYILEELPDAIKHPEHGYKWRLQLKKIGKWYVASYENELWVRVYMANEYRTDEKLYTWKEPYTADTPLKALLKLTIALHEAGQLNNTTKEEI